jgi:hypothetical protein
MSTPIIPTPNPDVNALLENLQSKVQTILGNRLVGMYLYGSLASGAFDSGSDIDVVVVTDGDLSSVLFSNLHAMHLGIAAGDSPWATELEASYIPQSALRRYDPTHTLHPRIERGETLRMEQHGSDWIIQRYDLRKNGIVMWGPSPQSLIDPISPGDLRRAAAATLREWWVRMLDDPGQLNSRGYQSYAVLTMCRILYTLEYCTVASKPVAARWAKSLGEEWIPLIEQAQAARHDPKSKPLLDDISGTLDLIRYALRVSEQFAMSEGPVDA